jgi:hypothetical protein
MMRHRKGWHDPGREVSLFEMLEIKEADSKNIPIIA